MGYHDRYNREWIRACGGLQSRHVDGCDDVRPPAREPGRAGLPGHRLQQPRADRRARPAPRWAIWRRTASALLDDLGIETCVLAGMSVGGLMALEFALTYPERLQGLIVIARHPRWPTPAEEREQYHRQFDKLDVERHGAARLRRVGGALLLRRDDARPQPGARRPLDRALGDDGAGPCGALPGPLVDRQGGHHRPPRDRRRPGTGDSRRGGRADPHRSRAQPMADALPGANVRAYPEGRGTRSTWRRISP